MRSKAETRQRAKTKRTKEVRIAFKIISILKFTITLFQVRPVSWRGGAAALGGESVNILCSPTLNHRESRVASVPRERRKGRVRARTAVTASENHCRPNIRTTEISRPETIYNLFFLAIGRPSGFLRRLEKKFPDGSGAGAGSEPLS